MTISGKQALAYDVKVFKNAFICTVVDTESDEFEIFEVSQRKNQMKDIIGVFSYPNYIFLGYNTIHYSIPLLNFVFENYRAMPYDCNIICGALYNLGDTIINSEDFSLWSKWKHTRNFLTLDFYTMLAPAKKRLSLKEVQITSGYPTIRQFEMKPEISVEEIDEVIQCSLNDARSIKYIAYQVEDKIRLRESASKKYDINLLSKDNVSMGLEIVKKKYLERTGLEWNNIKDDRSPCDVIALKDCLPQFIEFNTPVLKDLVEELKKTSVSADGKKQFEKHFLLDDMEISVGMGGVHSIVREDEIKPNDDEEIIDVDIKSAYPSFILSYGCVPKHLNSSAFLYIFKEIWDAKMKADEQNDETTRETMKNALNSIIGNYRVPSSWLYSPLCAVKVNISCQLFILKLAEMLIDAGAKIKQINTDGIMFIGKKNFDYKYNILNVWQGLTMMKLDYDSFTRVYQSDINNYLCIRSDGSTKKVGLFDDKQIINKGVRPTIIAKAVNEYFVNGIAPEDTIKSSRCINDFILYQKVDKAHCVEYNDKLIHRTNRYYASVNGCAIYKMLIEQGDLVQCAIVHLKKGTYVKVPRASVLPGGEYYNNPDVSYIEYNGGTSRLENKKLKPENMLRASGVTLANDLTQFNDSFPTNINYIYYIGEAKKIISSIENRQLSLF